MTHKENKKKIDLLRSQIISDIKNSDWSPSYSGFENENFRFKEDKDTSSSNLLDIDFLIWFVIIKYDKYNTSHSIKVSDIINPIHFWFLRLFYIRKALNNNDVYKKEKLISDVVDKFYKNKKDLKRDFKLDQILDK